VKWAPVVAVPEHMLVEKEVVAVVKVENYSFASAALVVAKAAPYCCRRSSRLHSLRLILLTAALGKGIAGWTLDVVAVVKKDVGKLCWAVAGLGWGMAVKVAGIVLGVEHMTEDRAVVETGSHHHIVIGAVRMCLEGVHFQCSNSHQPHLVRLTVY
jgi:hypothetical protein